MKIIHTSDWHIGRVLYGRARYDEYEAFLDWLAALIASEDINLLLVAGDVFDNSTPSNHAQELYYRFLCRVAASSHCHVVVTAGNHDSPSFLAAPRELLKFLNIHVVGCASASPDDEIVVIKGPDGGPRLIVCAVPYLRDRDIRTAEAGESVEAKEQKIIAGIRAHYRMVYDAAQAKRTLLNRDLPIVAMGHLYAAGGKTVDGDGVRELYIGSLLHVGTDIFPESIDYLALGHLHIPQTVGDSNFIRYSGSPLPIGFGEANQKKSVVLVDFSEQKRTVTTISTPHFQELLSLKGDWQDISRKLMELKEKRSTAWIEIIYEGSATAADLQARLDEAVEGSELEILRVRNNRLLSQAMSGQNETEALSDLNPTEVFERCLEARNVAAERRPALLNAYREIIVSLNEQDPQAE
ncbi:MAG: exonuclease SbcCD subunit D C-terminal domain-containing protein [Syntrophobacterales bacterium]|nr:exonuclease SbcCD subunit D C-terminal domain-containing protein [Syntrophobacterales bacterium]